MNHNNFSNDIVRIEDLPYFRSPPYQFTLTQTATLDSGQYPFNNGRSTLIGDKNLTDNTLMYIKAMSFSADISRQDYQDSLAITFGPNVPIDTPRFSIFFQSGSNSPLLQDPLICQDYFYDQEFKLLLLPKVFPNRISGFFRGTLEQTANLAGITDITLTMQIWVQFVDDDNFVQSLKLPYPRIKREPR